MPYNELKPQSKIIAVGGAKGGISKSLFAVNLGVHYARQGKRTVLIDLDLGGANLHLFLGLWSLKYRLDDYLGKKSASLEGVMTETKYGLFLIGGGGGGLGSANIPFAQKLKLLRAIKRLEADYIILDLGGDTSFNIIDFYLAADCGIVLTSCDPTSYLDAYSFIKASLYRRLTRLFGPESLYRKQKNTNLLSLIDDFVSKSGGNGGSYVTDLIENVGREVPEALDLTLEVLNGFKPNVVVNMTSGDSDVGAIVGRLQKVSAKMLSIDIRFLTSIPLDDNVKRSANDLVPELARNTDGILSDRIQQVAVQI